jgi:hypothetical protein
MAVESTESMDMVMLFLSPSFAGALILENWLENLVQVICLGVVSLSY